MLTRRFLPIRDKGDGHHRSKSMPPADKQRPFAADTLRSIFKRDSGKHNGNEASDAGRDTEKEAFQIDQVQHRLKELNITDVSADHIRDILATNIAAGSALKASEFIDIEHKASSGVLVNYDPGIHLLGAVNRQAVTCYLDALLFAMFVRLDSFECMLKNDFPLDDPKHNLVNLLRIWVNMLRSGKLIETDLTQRIQEAIAECGWESARLLEQQDTSEAFAFLTETLQLPLLPLQVDLFHHGKRDEGDSKVVHERLLNLAVPEDTDGKGIKLEDCLEEYFNTRVDVLRDSEVAKKSMTADSLATPTPGTPATPTTPRLGIRNTIRLVNPEVSEGSVMMSASPIAMSPNPLSDGEAATQVISDEQDARDNSDFAVEDITTAVAKRDHLLTERSYSQPADVHTVRPGTHPSVRHRSASVIQHVMIDDQGRPTTTDDNSVARRAKRAGSTVVKAVTIPAWQFFRLIPWHSLTKNEPKDDSEVAMNFDQKPVVGICLKRYGMDNGGQPIRRDTYIDIPDSLRLPRFMLAADEDFKVEEELDEFLDYKLVLQSVICHRGQDLQSGHYYSFARVAPKRLTDNRRHDFDPPPDYEEAQWVCFDDLNEERRVTYVDDIKQSLKANMPYLLFYQVVPIVEVAASTEGTEAGPPSYNDARVSLEITAPDCSPGPNSRTMGFFDAAETLRMARAATASARASLDVDRGSRRSFEAAGGYSYTNSLAPESRRQSVVFTDSAAITPAITPDGHSPLMSPTDEMSTSTRLSRAASRFTKGRSSRPESQNGGDRRMSLTMSRLSGMMRPSKEPLSEPTKLDISAAASPATETMPESVEPGEEAGKVDGEGKPAELVEGQDQAGQAVASATKPRSGKGREKKRKERKARAESQPERECTVM